MFEFRVENSKIVIGSNHVDLQHNIFRVLERNDMLIIHLLDPNGAIEDEPDNNVLAINNTGEIVWRIDQTIGKDNFYVNIGFDTLGNLLVTDFSGLLRYIDISNWKMTKKEIVK